MFVVDLLQLEGEMSGKHMLKMKKEKKVKW